MDEGMMEQEQAEPAGAPLRCQRCKYGWTYEGSKLAEAKTAAYPVYTSCPKCGTTVRVAVEGGAYVPGRARGFAKGGA